MNSTEKREGPVAESIREANERLRIAVERGSSDAVLDAARVMLQASSKLLETMKANANYADASQKRADFVDLPLEPTFELIVAGWFNGDASVAIGHAHALEEAETDYRRLILATIDASQVARLTQKYGEPPATIENPRAEKPQTTADADHPSSKDSSVNHGSAIPTGWIIERRDDGLAVIAPECDPGGLTMTGPAGPLPNRLLYRLAEDLLKAAGR